MFSKPDLFGIRRELDRTTSYQFGIEEKNYEDGVLVPHNAKYCSFQTQP